MKRKEKEKKKNINNDLGVFPSHDINPLDVRLSSGYLILLLI